MFSIFSGQEQIFDFRDKSISQILIVSDDDPNLIDWFKTATRKDIFTTPLTNLKFKPNFLTFDDELLNVLLIKSPKQVQKVFSNQLIYPEFTFKVIKQNGFKKMKGYKPENKFLELEIEPLDVGIEGLPKINKIHFYFFTQDPIHISPTDKQLDKTKYEKLFRNAEEKEYIIKSKKLIFGSRRVSYKDENFKYDTLSFGLERDIAEIKKKENVVSNQESQINSKKNKFNFLMPILIVGGMLVFFIIISYLLRKSKK